MRFILTALFVLFFWPQFGMAQIEDTLYNSDYVKSKREVKKEQRKLARKQMTEHFKIGLFGTYSFINSSARFEGPNSILSVNIDLEKHLGLADKKMVYYGTFVYRITPRSGINAIYYQLNRNKDHTLDTEIIFLGDTIPKGQVLGGFMNTSIVSFGYIYSILTEEKLFFGAFLNLYLASIKVGIKSEAFKIERSSQYFAATPNFGLLASFNIAKWMAISGGFGVFFFNTEEWSGTFLDLQLMADFFPTKWLGLSVGYQAFDVQGKFLEEYFTASFNYNLRGPAFGLKFIF